MKRSPASYCCCYLYLVPCLYALGITHCLVHTSQLSRLLVIVSEREKDQLAFTCKNRSAMEPVPTCEHKTYYPIVRSWCDGSSDRSFMVDQLSYFSFQPVLYDWCNKGRGMCYLVCGIMHIKEQLLLIGKSSLCGGSGFPLSLFVWSVTIICLTPYNVLSAS